MKKKKIAEAQNTSVITRQVEESTLVDARWHKYQGKFQSVGGHYLLDGNYVHFSSDLIAFKQEDFPLVTVIDREPLVVPNCFSADVRDILGIFSQIARPYSVVNYKLQAICDLLESFGFSPELQRVPGYHSNIIVPSKGETKRVIMTHYDLIPLFDNGFWAGDCLYFDGDEIQGALDNTITNAVAIYMLQSGLIPEDTAVVFSSEEEIGGNGAAEYMRSIAGNKDSIAFINLDVTNEFKDCDSVGLSIEYDAYNAENIPKLWEFCQTGASRVTFDRVGDDMCTILRHGGRGASFCLPTKKGIHSFKNKTSATKISKYVSELSRILNSNIDFTLQSHSRSLSIEKFEKTNGFTSEEILEKFKYVARTSGNGFWGGSSRSSASLFDDDFWSRYKSNGNNEANSFSSTIYDREENVVYTYGQSDQDDFEAELDAFIETNGPYDKTSKAFQKFEAGVYQYIAGEINREEMEEIRSQYSPYQAELYKKQFWSGLDAAFDSVNSLTEFDFDENEKMTPSQLADMFSLDQTGKSRLKRAIQGWLIEVNTDDDVLSVLQQVNPELSQGEQSEFFYRMQRLATS